ncbi:MAG TPA: hypothetical protein VEJ63_03930 [Planctomycetota bacterium]|nr:hypothetical protein [Planctomycetota bacterium]
MKKLMTIFAAAAMAACSVADEREAAALADTGVALLNTSKEKARSCLLRALVHDSRNPVALYELGKLYETEGDTTAAANFLSRAATELGMREKNNPAYASKRADALRRLQKLNPYAAQYTAHMEEYAAELGKIVKKSSDAMTIEEASRRVETLSLGRVISADKMPLIPRAATKTADRAGNSSGIAPDVERALTAAGWNTISGTWKKLAEGKYEVSDGRLAAKKCDGAVQLFVHRGSTGTVEAFIRTRDKFSDWGEMTERFARGYGVVLKDRNARIYTPARFIDGEYGPVLHHDSSLPDQARHLILITIQDSKMEISVNGKKESNCNYPIPKEGGFEIKVEGTAIIETPQAAGK